MMRCIMVVCLGLIVQCAGSQNLGLLPPSVQWMQINTDTARIIFPEHREAIALDVARYIHAMAEKYPPSDPSSKVWKVNILLQDQTDVSNGYVGYAPFRSEFYLAPGQDNFQLGTLEWHKLLAFHEYRHVQQGYSGFRGWSKAMYYLFGQEAYSGALHLSVPDWFIEGDAVVAETDLTNQGRGSLSAFYDGLREKASSGEAWSYAKLRNGSYKEWLPSHYPLGYLLVEYGKEQFGADLWDNVYNDAMAYESIVYPFSNALEEQTGLHTDAFYNEAMKAYSHTLSNIDEAGNINKKNIDFNGKYLSMHTPAISENGNVFVLGERFDENSAIYEVVGQKLNTICRVGVQHESAFSYQNEKFTWAEMRVHPRWERKDYSVVMLYNLQTGKRQQLTRRSHMYMPALSPDGKKIVVVERGDDMSYHLSIIESETGAPEKRIINPESYYYSYPVWSPDQKSIVVTLRDSAGKCLLAEFHLGENSWKYLADFGFDPIGKPSVSDEWIVFSHDSDPANAILGLHRPTGRLSVLGKQQAALYDPVQFPGGDSIVCTGFTLEGRRLRTLHTHTSDEFENGTSGNKAVKRVTPIYHSPQAQQFVVKKYPALGRLFNIHSWRPDFDDPVSSITLSSTNILHTLDIDAGFQYNNNDGAYGPFCQIRFGYFFPEIQLGYTGTSSESIIQQVEYNWFQHDIYGGLSLPLQWIRGQSIIDFIPTTYLSHASRRFRSIDFESSVTSAQGFLQFAHRKARARQHPVSRFGQWISLGYRHSIDTLDADQFTLETDLTFPSIFRNHVLWLQFDYRHELRSNAYYFADVFEYARGYPALPGDEVWRVGFKYLLPVLYPDFGVGGIAYWKRLCLMPFYDHNISMLDGNKREFRSAGLEAIFDLRIFNVEDVQFGFRWSRLFDEDIAGDLDRNYFEFFIPFERLQAD